MQVQSANHTTFSIISNSLQQTASLLNNNDNNENSISTLIEISSGGDTNDLKSSEISENLSKSLDLAKNYSLLISKLEELTSGLTDGFNGDSIKKIELIQPIEHGFSEKNYARFVSDIWIGIVLTLLISSIIFFICSCFIYHKFQQWKASCRQDHHGDQSPDFLRRYDIDVESLPSYTLVSGLPTYDDALEQIRKPGIIITTPNIMKIFENYKPPNETNQTNSSTENIQTSKSNQDLDSHDSTNTCTSDGSSSTTSTTSISSPSLSTSQNIPTIMITPNLIESTSSNGLNGGINNVTQIIELGPDQLNLLSQKRLSVQITFNAPSVSRSQTNLTHLKSSLNGKLNILSNNDFPLLHGRTPSLSIRHLQDRRSSDFIRNSLYIKNLKRNAQHRGSLG